MKARRSMDGLDHLAAGFALDAAAVPARALASTRAAAAQGDLPGDGAAPAAFCRRRVVLADADDEFAHRRIRAARGRLMSSRLRRLARRKSWLLPPTASRR